MRKGDGGSHENQLNVMGERNKDKLAAKEGEQVFEKIMKKVVDALPPNEPKPIIGYWCNNHNNDEAVARDVENCAQCGPYFGRLLSFLDSIVTHMMGNTSARNSLWYIADMISVATRRKNTSSSRKSLCFCAHHYISSFSPMHSLIGEMDHFIKYMVLLHVLGACSGQVPKRLIAIAFEEYKGAIKCYYRGGA